MPKMLPGMTVEFAVVADDGRAEMGKVRAMPGVLPFKLAREVTKILKSMEKDSPEPAKSE